VLADGTRTRHLSLPRSKCSLLEMWGVMLNGFLTGF
jgi:hypothetical protein